MRRSLRLRNRFSHDRIRLSIPSQLNAIAAAVERSMMPPDPVAKQAKVIKMPAQSTIIACQLIAEAKQQRAKILELLRTGPKTNDYLLRALGVESATLYARTGLLKARGLIRKTSDCPCIWEIK